MCVGTWRCSTTCWNQSKGFLATSCCSKTTWKNCPTTPSTGKTQRVRHTTCCFHCNTQTHSNTVSEESSHSQYTLLTTLGRVSTPMVQSPFVLVFKTVVFHIDFEIKWQHISRREWRGGDSAWTWLNYISKANIEALPFSWTLDNN